MLSKGLEERLEILRGNQIKEWHARMNANMDVLEVELIFTDLIRCAKKDEELSGKYREMKREYQKMMAIGYEAERRKKRRDEMMTALRDVLRGRAEATKCGELNRKLFQKLVIAAHQESVLYEFTRSALIVVSNLEYLHADQLADKLWGLAELYTKPFEIATVPGAGLMPVAHKMLAEMAAIDALGQKGEEKDGRSWKDAMGIQGEWQKMVHILEFEQNEVLEAIGNFK